MKLKIHKGSTVQVITGADKGKRGSVLDIDPKKMRILVQGVRMITRHDRKEGILKKEGYLHYSNVKLVEAVAKKEKKESTKKKASAKK
jgi:large subunit ribosomal protein L24